MTELLSGNVFAAMLVFVRVGAAALLLPGLAAAYVGARTRLLFALAVSVAVVPVLAGRLPALPVSPIDLVSLVSTEAAVGVFLGMVTRILIAALHAAGTFASLFMSLASALIQDPVAEAQTSTIAGFFVLVGTLLVFVTDLHHLMIRAIVGSYDVLPAGTALPVGDVGDALARQLADSFALGLQLAMPFAVIGLVYAVGLGLLSRLMPQLPVFFFGLPLQIALQVWAMVLALSAIMLMFLDHFAEALSRLWAG
jgi:flagellar biosynthetic protein FliR